MRFTNPFAAVVATAAQQSDHPVIKTGSARFLVDARLPPAGLSP